MVTTPLALHVMEDGCIAAPERGVSIKYTKMIVIKQVHLCTINTYMYDRDTSHAVHTSTDDFIRTVCHGGGLSCYTRS